MFGHVQLLSSTGAADGYVASFIHTHGGVSYYGARYYDARQQFVRDDPFLSRVVSLIFFSFCGRPFTKSSDPL